jgi:hypothetical protein
VVRSREERLENANKKKCCNRCCHSDATAKCQIIIHCSVSDNMPKQSKNKTTVADPIWIAYKGGDFTLLDGAHRIVATYLENKRTILAYVVRVD